MARNLTREEWEDLASRAREAMDRLSASERYDLLASIAVRPRKALSAIYGCPLYRDEIERLTKVLKIQLTLTDPQRRNKNQNTINDWPQSRTESAQRIAAICAATPYRHAAVADEIGVTITQLARWLTGSALPNLKNQISLIKLEAKTKNPNTIW